MPPVLIVMPSVCALPKQPLRLVISHFAQVLCCEGGMTCTDERIELAVSRVASGPSSLLPCLTFAPLISLVRGPYVPHSAESLLLNRVARAWPANAAFIRPFSFVSAHSLALSSSVLPLASPAACPAPRVRQAAPPWPSFGPPRCTRPPGPRGSCPSPSPCTAAASATASDGYLILRATTAIPSRSFGCRLRG